MTLTNLLTGFQFVFASPIVLGTITLDLFAVLLGGATALLPVYAKDILHVGPNGLGLPQAALPTGSLLCAFALAHLPPMEKAGRNLLWSVAIFGLATIGFGVSHWFWFSIGMLFICGAADHIIQRRYGLPCPSMSDEDREPLLALMKRLEYLARLIRNRDALLNHQPSPTPVSSVRRWVQWPQLSP